MGEATRNPSSPQFKGPLKENQITPAIVTQVTPSEQWLADNPGADPETCPVEHMEVAFILSIDWKFPSALHRNRPDKWPGAVVPVAILCRESLRTLHRRVAVEMASRGQVAPPLAGSEEPGGPPPPETDPDAS